MRITFTIKRLVIISIITFIVALCLAIGLRLYLDSRDTMTDISWEYFRIYHFSNGETITIIDPVYYVEDNGFHYIINSKGWTYKIRNDSYDYMLIYPDPEKTKTETFGF